jgi:hypothetical protein
MLLSSTGLRGGAGTALAAGIVNVFDSALGNVSAVCKVAKLAQPPMKTRHAACKMLAVRILRSPYVNELSDQETPHSSDNS